MIDCDITPPECCQRIHAVVTGVPMRGHSRSTIIRPTEMDVLNKKYFFLLFLLFLASGASAQWVRSAKSRAFSRANAVATDPSGNVLTAGIFSCITVFDGDSLLNNSCGEVTPPAPASSQVDAFVSKRDANGNLIWVSHFPGSAGNLLSINDIDVDNAGNSYITGAYTGSLDLIAEQLLNPDATTEFFLARVLADGTTDWVISYSADALSESSGQRLSVTPNAVYVTGYVRDDFQIGTVTDSVGNNASFAAAFDLSGSPLWTKNFEEFNDNTSSRGKAIEAQGDSIWVFSTFTDTVKIEGTAYPPPGNVGTATAGVICLYNAAGTLLDVVRTNTPLIESIKLHRPDASLYITGRSENTTAINGDTIFNTPGVRAFVSSHSLDLATPQWTVALTAASSTALTGTDLDVSAQGSIFASGTFSGATLTAPSTSATGGGGQNGYLVKIDAAGNDLWLQTFGGAGDDALSSTSAPDDNQVFAAGYFSSYVRVAGDEIFSSSGNNGLVARIDTCPQLIADMITADSIFICKRQTALFQVTNNAANTYQWYRDGSVVPLGTAADLNVSAEGIYRAKITGSGCSKFTPTARLFLYPLPDSVVLTNDALEQCAGDSVLLTGPIGSYTFQWFDGATALPETTKDIKIKTNGDYHVEVTDTLGCSIISKVFTVQFHPYPSGTLTPATGTYKLCSGNALTVTADNSQPGMSWQWRKNDLPIPGATLDTYDVTQSGIYHAVVSNAIGCQTVTDADTVVVQSSPLVDLNDETTPPDICDGASVRLVTQQVIGQTYQWMKDGADISGATTNTLDVATAGEYIVHVKNALCEKFSEPFTLAVHPLPVANILNNASASICEGDEYALQALENPGYSYAWLNNDQVLPGETLPALAIEKTGNYKLRVASPFGCSVTSAATAIHVNLKPPAAVTAEASTTFCEGGSVVLRANTGPGLSYQWSRDGADIAGETEALMQADQSGSFAVTVTNSNLCSGTSQPAVVQVVPIPVASIASGDGSDFICERDSLELVAGSSPSYEFQWLHNDTPVGSSGATFFAQAEGTYRVVASVGTCRDTSSVLVLRVRANPLPIVTRNKEFLSVALFGDIQWYRDGQAIPGGKQQAIHADADGVYVVNVVNAAGCSASSDPVPVCLPLPEIIRENDVLRVSIGGGQYRWEYGGIPINGAAQRTLTVQQSGSYTAVVTSADGCVMETAAVVACVPYPYIEQDNVTGVLYAYPHPATAYQWYLEGAPIAGGTTQVEIPDRSGAYTVTVTDLEGCASESAPFTVTPVTGTEGNFLRAVRIYPNPAKNFIHIEKRAEAAKVSIAMLDAAGREVFHRDAIGVVEDVDISAFTAGVYTIIIGTDKQTASWKLIKR